MYEKTFEIIWKSIPIIKYEVNVDMDSSEMSEWSAKSRYDMNDERIYNNFNAYGHIYR